VARDDRWGRTYESFGEDPSIGNPLASAAVTGFQGTSLSSTSVLATAKHFVADGGTKYGTGSSGYLIDQGDAQITEAQLDAIHLPPFQNAVNAGVGSVMVSYSSWNGVKNHGNGYLINTVLKGQLGFKGFVVSDWAGVKQLSDSTYAAQVAHAVNAGIDMIMVPDDYVGTINAIVNGVNSGLIPLARVNDAVTRILNEKFALGLFSQPYTDSTYTAQVGSPAHRAVARQAVRESLVLLKNDGVLPLSKTGTYKIVVGGKSVDNLGYQMGGWLDQLAGRQRNDDDRRHDLLAGASAGDRRHEHLAPERRDAHERELLGRHRHLGRWRRRRTPRARATARPSRSGRTTHRRSPTSART